MLLGGWLPSHGGLSQTTESLSFLHLFAVFISMQVRRFISCDKHTYGSPSPGRGKGPLYVLVFKKVTMLYDVI